MIESGVGIPSPEQIAQLAALAVLLGTAYSLDRACSPKVETRPPVNSKEQVELLTKFAELPLSLQRGMLKYAYEMRNKYQKT